MKDGCCSITLGNVDVLTIHNGRCYARPIFHQTRKFNFAQFVIQGQDLRYTKLSLRFSRILEFSLRQNGNMNHSNLKKFPNFFLSPSQQKNECPQVILPWESRGTFMTTFPPFFIGLSRRDSRSDFFLGIERSSGKYLWRCRL